MEAVHSATHLLATTPENATKLENRKILVFAKTVKYVAKAWAGLVGFAHLDIMDVINPKYLWPPMLKTCPRSFSTRSTA